MHDTILALAQTISGAADTERSLLELLCTAQEQEWEERLRRGICAGDCEDAFVCAVAFSAVAGLMTGRGNRDAVSSFTAGSVSVSGPTAADTACAANAMRALAERLMAPYTVSESFAFRGVRS